MRLGAYPARLTEGSLVAEIYGSTRFPSGTGTATRSTTPTGPRWKTPGCGSPAPRRTRSLVEFVELDRCAAPVPGRDPGAPGVQVPADPAAPAVRGVRPGRPGLPGVRTAADRRRPASRIAEPLRGPGGRRGRSVNRPPPAAGAATDQQGPRVFSVVSSERVFDGVVASLRVDEVVMPGGGTAKREVVEHGGAVAIVALDTAGPLDQAAGFEVVDAEESADMVILIEQYRHPLGRRLWELPAGLMDVDGEPGQLAAARELVCSSGS